MALFKEALEDENEGRFSRQLPALLLFIKYKSMTYTFMPRYG